METDAIAQVIQALDTRFMQGQKDSGPTMLRDFSAMRGALEQVALGLSNLFAIAPCACGSDEGMTQPDGSIECRGCGETWILFNRQDFIDKCKGEK